MTLGLSHQTSATRKCAVPGNHCMPPSCAHNSTGPLLIGYPSPTYSKQKQAGGPYNNGLENDKNEEHKPSTSMAEEESHAFPGMHIQQLCNLAVKPQSTFNRQALLLKRVFVVTYTYCAILYVWCRKKCILVPLCDP